MVMDQDAAAAVARYQIVFDLTTVNATGSRTLTATASPLPRLIQCMPDLWRRRMARRILIVEPYEDLAELLVLYVNELGYEFDLLTNAEVDEEHLNSNSYDCVLINADQNSGAAGIRLAETAGRASTPVVFIADHATAASSVPAEGWKPLQKSFTQSAGAICQAVGVVRRQRETRLPRLSVDRSAIM
jgi:DNA-binding NtrC family response regulator